MRAFCGASDKVDELGRLEQSTWAKGRSEKMGGMQAVTVRCREGLIKGRRLAEREGVKVTAATCTSESVFFERDRDAT